MASAWRNPETDPPPIGEPVLALWTEDTLYEVARRTADDTWADSTGSEWGPPDYWQPLPAPPVPRD